MKTVIDQMNRSVSVPLFPKRIISLVPSQTELLFDLGLGDRVIGITKFCIYPNEWFSQQSKVSKQRVGGTKNVNFEIIEQLQPDLIIGNKEENNESDITTLFQKYAVWMSDIYTLEDALKMIIEIGTLTQSSEKSIQLKNTIQYKANQHLVNRSNLTCVYLIWNNPIMTVGKHTFIDAMIAKTGLENLILQERYPVITEETLTILAPDVLLLSSEPFPFNETHILQFQLLLPKTKILIVDGELFSWYGSRLLHSFEYISKLNFT